MALALVEERTLLAERGDAEERRAIHLGVEFVRNAPRLIEHDAQAAAAIHEQNRHEACAPSPLARAARRDERA